MVQQVIHVLIDSFGIAFDILFPGLGSSVFTFWESIHYVTRYHEKLLFCGSRLFFQRLSKEKEKNQYAFTQ